MAIPVHSRPSSPAAMRHTNQSPVNNRSSGPSQSPLPPPGSSIELQSSPAHHRANSGPTIAISQFAEPAISGGGTGDSSSNRKRTTGHHTHSHSHHQQQTQQQQQLQQQNTTTSTSTATSTGSNLTTATTSTTITTGTQQQHPNHHHNYQQLHHHHHLHHHHQQSSLNTMPMIHPHTVMTPPGSPHMNMMANMMAGSGGGIGGAPPSPAMTGSQCGQAGGQLWKTRLTNIKNSFLGSPRFHRRKMQGTLCLNSF